MQKSQALINSIKDAMKKTLVSLEELKSLDVDLPFEVEERDGNVYITSIAANLPASQKFNEELSHKEFAKAAALQFIGRSLLLPIPYSSRKTGCEKNQREPPAKSTKIHRRSILNILEFMCIIDCFRWDYDDSDYRVKEIKIISEHFCQPLLQHKFKGDPAINEFRELKRLVESHYRQLSHSCMIWDAIFKHHSVKFDHILILAEPIIVM